MPVPIPGYPSTGWTAAYGGVPRVPDPLSTMQETLRGGISAIPSLEELTTGVSGASAAGARTQYEANLPLYGPMSRAASENIMSNLQGIVSPDVINMLRSQGAERGVGFGPDSPASNAAYLRALGLTSTALQSLGQQQYQSALASTPRGPLFDPSKFLVSPGEEQMAQLYANILAGAPIPSAAAAANEAAARRGLTAGAGSVGGGGPISMGGGRPPVVTAGGYPPTVVAGATPYGGGTPALGDFSTGDWWKSIGWPGSTGTELGTDQFGEDLYTYSGFTPEDISTFGLTEQDIYGTSPGGATTLAAGGLGGADNWWEQMYEDYDPFGVMGPYEGVDLGTPSAAEPDYSYYDYGLASDTGDYYGDYP